MLENHILHDPSVGAQRQNIPGFVFHWDTNTSRSLAEAASLCSRGIKVRLLVSWSNYRQMKKLYEDFARKVVGQIEVRPLLFEDTEFTVSHIRNLMAFRDGPTETPLYLEVIQNILRRLGRKSEPFSVKTFLGDLAVAGLSPAQLQMLDQRLSILKTFSAATAPDIVEQDHKNLNPKGLERERIKQGLGFKGNCITVERGTLTIIDLSDPFVDASTACILFDIYLAIILKRHKEAITANKIKPGLYRHSRRSAQISRQEYPVRRRLHVVSPHHHPRATPQRRSRHHRHARTYHLRKIARPLPHQHRPPLQLTSLVHYPLWPPWRSFHAGGRGEG
jgi:hypothetical protein